MIKFNLLGNNTAIDYRGKYLLVVYLAATFFICLHFGSTYVANKREIANFDLQAKTLEAELSVIKKETQSVKDLEGKRTQLNKKLSVVAKLRRSRSGVVRLLDDFNLAIPSRVWIMDFTENAQNVVINGRALENQDIAQFMKRLEKSDHFLTIDLVESRQSKLQGGGATPAGTQVAAVKGGQATGSLAPQSEIDIKEFSLRAKISYLGKLRRGDFKIPLS